MRAWYLLSLTNQRQESWVIEGTHQYSEKLEIKFHNGLILLSNIRQTRTQSNKISYQRRDNRFLNLVSFSIPNLLKYFFKNSCLQPLFLGRRSTFSCCCHQQSGHLYRYGRTHRQSWTIRKETLHQEAPWDGRHWRIDGAGQGSQHGRGADDEGHPEGKIYTQKHVWAVPEYHETGSNISGIVQHVVTIHWKSLNWYFTFFCHWFLIFNE